MLLRGSGHVNRELMFLLHENRGKYYHVTAQCEDGDQGRAIAARRVVADSILQRDAMLKQKRPADAPASAGAFRDSWGRMRPTPEVFTSVRIDVLSAGGVIAPIYDEYLNVLRAKGFVDSWHWPCETELSVQVPH